MPTAGMPNTSPSCVSSNKDATELSVALVSDTATFTRLVSKVESHDSHDVLWSNKSHKLWQVPEAKCRITVERQVCQDTPSAMIKASLHILWISIRWRPAISTNKPFLTPSSQIHWQKTKQNLLKSIEISVVSKRKGENVLRDHPGLKCAPAVEAASPQASTRACAEILKWKQREKRRSGVYHPASPCVLCHPEQSELVTNMTNPWQSD